MAQGYKINFDKEIEIVVLLPNYQKILSFAVKNRYRLVACEKRSIRIWGKHLTEIGTILTEKIHKYFQGE